MSSTNTTAKPNKLWLLLNSGFVLWILSVVLITLGGGYITTNQQCIRDADQIIERRAEIRSEIFYRVQKWGNTVSEVRSFDRLPRATLDKSDRNSKLAPVPKSELEKEIYKLNQRVTLDPLEGTETGKDRDTINQFLSEEAVEISRSIQEPITDHPLTTAEKGKYLSQHQKAVAFQQAYNSWDFDMERLAYDFSPNCGPKNLFAITFGGKPAIVFGAKSSAFEVLQPLLMVSAAGVKSAIDDLKKEK